MGKDLNGKDIWDFQRHPLATNTELYATIFISLLVIAPWLVTHKVNLVAGMLRRTRTMHPSYSSPPTFLNL